MLKVYGLPSCDTVRKARKWLESQGAEHQFFAFAKMDDLEAKAAEWLAAMGPEALVNPRSRNFKALSEDEQALVLAGAPALLAATPQLMKRPIIETKGKTLAGFNEAEWQALI